MDERENTQNAKIHKILAHSYSIYLATLLLGVLLDFLYPQKLFSDSIMIQVGTVFLGFSTALIFWAQHTSRNLDITNLTKESFCRGPYRCTRTPTHWGLFFLMLGFGIVANSLYVIGLSFLAFLVTKFIFIKQEEDVLAEKYGQPYLEYKKSVKL